MLPSKPPEISMFLATGGYHFGKLNGAVAKDKFVNDTGPQDSAKKTES